MDSIVPNYRPQAGDYPSYYQNYFSWATEDQPFLESFQYAIQDGLEFWHNIKESESEYSYEVGKWKIKELMQHIIDVERVFVYRAMSIVRGETKVLPGFDHDAYVENSAANDRSWAAGRRAGLPELRGLRHHGARARAAESRWRCLRR